MPCKQTWWHVSGRPVTICMWVDLLDLLTTVSTMAKYRSHKDNGLLFVDLRKKKIKQFQKNWRHITLLNTVYKIAFSRIAARLMTALPKLIGDDQKWVFWKADFTPTSWRGWRVFAWRKRVCHVTGFLLLLGGYYSGTVMKKAGFPHDGKSTTWLIFCCSWWRQVLYW